ncbi:hypothetical protein EDD18DRAFT_1205362 [Armillaria luteobubalina]|uniref:F-box domain-containing protein n=1 Tax=Armillaria luteobubalina TaxID=153913 RepID=A0AA39PA83_9AGAR|nr:hypothetical protein EDD18DRAFT_1205362 [Armillaria luteobubalina]
MTETIHAPDFLASLSSKYAWLKNFSSELSALSIHGSNTLLRTTLNGSMRNVDEAAKTIEADIITVRSALAYLERQRAYVKQINADYRATYSRIRTLPSDILIEIFFQTREPPRPYVTRFGDSFPGSFWVSDIKNGPWRLGQVCGAWRHLITQACPQLWSTIVLSFSWDTRRKKSVIQLLETALNRSRHHPISIQFFHEACQEFHEHDEDTGMMCFRLLMKQSYRWRHIYFDMPEYIYSVLSPIQGHIPLLESLHLTLGAKDSIPVHDPWTGAFAQAPSLKTAKFTDLSGNMNIDLPFSQLISFSDTRPYDSHELTRHFLSILRDHPQFQSFEYLSSEFPHDTPSFFEVSPRVRNPNVHKLSASDCSFLQSLELPSLEEMELATGTEDDDHEGWNVFCPPGALESLKILIYNSDCSLTNLTIAHAHLDDNLVSILRLSSTLSELKIKIMTWTVPVDDDTLRAIVLSLAEIDDHGQHRVVPCLCSLSIEACSFQSTARYQATFLDRKFVEMISSRVKMIEPHLRSLNIILQGQLEWSLSGRDENRLNPLSKNGLQVCLEMDEDDSSNSDSDSDDLDFGY